MRSWHQELRLVSSPVRGAGGGRRMSRCETRLCFEGHGRFFCVCGRWSIEIYYMLSCCKYPYFLGAARPITQSGDKHVRGKAFECKELKLRIYLVVTIEVPGRVLAGLDRKNHAAISWRQESLKADNCFAFSVSGQPKLASSAPRTPA